MEKSAKKAGKYPQESYSAVAWAMKSEWISLQCVTWDTGGEFAGTEKMLRETFLHSVFSGKTKTLSPILGSLSMMLANKDRLGLLNKVTSEKEKYPISQRGSAELIHAVMGGGSFFNTKHLLALGEERRDGQKHWDDANETKLRGLF